MATVPNITVIPATECIGNSLVSINTNYDNIKNSFTDFNTDLGVLNSQITNLTTIVNSISSAQLAKAWVNFRPTRNVNGQTSLTNTSRQLINSYNVSSVTREGAGVYTINFPVPYVNTPVVVGITSPDPNSTLNTNMGVVNLDRVSAFPAGNLSCKIVVRDLLGNNIDPSWVTVTFFNN